MMNNNQIINNQLETPADIDTTDTKIQHKNSNEEKHEQKWIPLEEIKPPVIKIRCRKGVIKISKNLLLKSKYFEAFFNRWSVKDVTHIDLPDDVDPDLFMEVIYKLKNPNHPIKFKVIKDYYDYYGVDYDKGKNKDNRNKSNTLSDIICIPVNKLTRLNSARIIEITRLRFYINTSYHFIYDVLSGLTLTHRPTDINMINLEKEEARSCFDNLLKDKSYYIKITDHASKNNQEQIIYLSDMNLYSARGKDSRLNKVTFQLPLKFLALGLTNKNDHDFSVEVFGGDSHIEISVISRIQQYD